MSEVEPGAASVAAELVVEDGRVVTPERVIRGDVRVADGRIVVVEPAGDGTEGDADGRIDARGRYVLPGLVDLHGDDIESHLYPRSGARVPFPMALATADRANLAAGVTTKFHAISFTDEPSKDRSPEVAAELVEGIAGDDDQLADHRVHVRCEVTDGASVDAVVGVLERGHADLVSVMSHIPGKGQFGDRDRFMAYYENHDRLSVEHAERLVEERTGIPDETLAARIDRVIEAADAAGVPVASHDDEDPVEVAGLYERGVAISEYPVTMIAAERAHALGMTTAMGAPNLVRGGSQWGNLSTVGAIAEDLVDALCADYHPPSLLAAPFVDTGEPLPERVVRVTRNPAAAVGLADRGRIEPGARADLLVVDPDPTPTVARGLVAGREVYHADGGGP